MLTLHVSFAVNLCVPTCNFKKRFFLSNNKMAMKPGKTTQCKAPFLQKVIKQFNVSKCQPFQISKKWVIITIF